MGFPWGGFFVPPAGQTGQRQGCQQQEAACMSVNLFHDGFVFGLVNQKLSFTPKVTVRGTG